jgi:DnaJ-class molecular chaperone
MKAIVLLLIITSSLTLCAQVNLDDELIPSQGSTNDNPVRHKLHSPNFQNRVVFEKADRRITRETRKRMKTMEDEKAQATANLKARIFSGEAGKLEDCDACAGKGNEKCTPCAGLGHDECLVCHGVKDLRCKRCEGAGMLFDQKCTSCDGTGIGVCKSCWGVTMGCKPCTGIGYFNCKKCGGAGKVFYSKKDSLPEN